MYVCDGGGGGVGWGCTMLLEDQSSLESSEKGVWNQEPLLYLWWEQMRNSLE